MNARLSVFARRQHGAFSLEQATAAGATPNDVQRLLLAGDWQEVHSKVYVASTTPLTHLTHCWAAVLAIGEPVALARRSAAMVLGLDRAPVPQDEAPELIVPRPRRSDTLIRPVHVRRIVARKFAVAHIGGLPVTPPALTLRELAAVLPRDWTRDMTQHALRRRLVTYPGLARELGRGLTGAAALRDVLLEVAPGYQVVWEGHLHRALLTAGLSLQPQVEVGLGAARKALLDLGDTRLRLGVEIDGLVNHLDRFAADRERDRLLVLAGWLILHVAASEVANNLPGVVRQIVEAAQRRADELGAVIRTA